MVKKLYREVTFPISREAFQFLKARARKYDAVFCKQSVKQIADQCYAERKQLLFSLQPLLAQKALLGMSVYTIPNHDIEAYTTILLLFDIPSLRNQFFEGLRMQPSYHAVGKIQCNGEPVIVRNRISDDWFVENVSDDVLGQYRARYVLTHHASIHFVLLVHSEEDATTFLQSCPDGTAHRVIFLDYDSILSNDFEFYRIVHGAVEYL